MNRQELKSLIAKRLYKLRAEVFKIRQIDLEERFGLALGVVSHYEQGVKRPCEDVCGKYICESAKHGEIIGMQYLRPDLFIDKEKYKSIIADRLRGLRVEKFKMSQRKLAEILYMTYQEVSRYELGRTKPNMKRCDDYINLAKAYGVEIDIRYLRPDLE